MSQPHSCLSADICQMAYFLPLSMLFTAVLVQLKGAEALGASRVGGTASVADFGGAGPKMPRTPLATSEGTGGGDAAVGEAAPNTAGVSLRQLPPGHADATQFPSLWTPRVQGDYGCMPGMLECSAASRQPGIALAVHAGRRALEMLEGPRTTHLRPQLCRIFLGQWECHMSQECRQRHTIRGSPGCLGPPCQLQHTTGVNCRPCIALTEPCMAQASAQDVARA